jgi:hypothetical protein
VSIPAKRALRPYVAYRDGRRGQIQSGEQVLANVAKARRVLIINTKTVMAGLVPAIHEHEPLASGKWMAGTSPAMTIHFLDNEGFVPWVPFPSLRSAGDDMGA